MMKSKHRNAAMASLRKISQIFRRFRTRQDAAAHALLHQLAQEMEPFLEERTAGSRQAATGPLDGVRLLNYHLDAAMLTFEYVREALPRASRQGRFLLKMAEVYQLLNDHEAALKIYEQLLGASQEDTAYWMKGEAQFRIGSLLAGRGEWDAALTMLREAIVSLQASGNTQRLILARIEIARIAYRRGEYLNAQKIFREAMQQCEQVNDVRRRAAIINHLGVISRMRSDTTHARACFQEALIEFQRIHDAEGAAECLNNLGVLHLHEGALQEANAACEKALQLCRRATCSALKAHIHLNKCEINLKIGDSPLAIRAAGKALEILSTVLDPVALARTGKLLGRLFRQARIFAIARSFYEESIAQYRELEIPLGLAACNEEYAQMLQEQGLQKEARPYLREAQSIHKVLQLQKAASESLEAYVEKKVSPEANSAPAPAPEPENAAA